jgi:hypothetical protein
MLGAMMEQAAKAGVNPQQALAMVAQQVAPSMAQPGQQAMPQQLPGEVAP